MPTKYTQNIKRKKCGLSLNLGSHSKNIFGYLATARVKSNGWSQFPYKISLGVTLNEAKCA